MNNKLTPQEIGRLLDRSAGQLDRRVLHKLQNAHRHALKKQRTSSTLWVSQDGLLHGRWLLSQRALSWIIVAVVASLLLINLAYWNNAYEHDHSEIDVAILTDDLPVDVFVD